MCSRYSGICPGVPQHPWTTMSLGTGADLDLQYIWLPPSTFCAQSSNGWWSLESVLTGNFMVTTRLRPESIRTSPLRPAACWWELTSQSGLYFIGLRAESRMRLWPGCNRYPKGLAILRRVGTSPMQWENHLRMDCVSWKGRTYPTCFITFWLAVCYDDQMNHAHVIISWGFVASGLSLTRYASVSWCYNVWRVLAQIPTRMTTLFIHSLGQDQ